MTDSDFVDFVDFEDLFDRSDLVPSVYFGGGARTLGGGGRSGFTAVRIEVRVTRGAEPSTSPPLLLVARDGG